MPDPAAILVAVGAAAAVAGALVLLSALPWRAPRPPRVAAGWVLAVGAGLYTGCWLLGL